MTRKSEAAGGLRRQTLGLLVAVGTALVGPATAGAATVGQVQTVAGTASLLAVACPTASGCSAVGNTTSVAGAVVPLTAGNAGTLQTVAGVAGLDGVACSGASTCVASGSASGESDSTNNVGELVPVASGIAGTAQGVAKPGHLNDVACPSAGPCVAVGGTGGTKASGLVVATSGGVAGAPQPVATASVFFRVACSSPTTCFAVGRMPNPQTSSLNATIGVVVPITNGTVGAAESVPGSDSLTGIACQTTTNCVATGLLTTYTADGSGGTSSNTAGVLVPILNGVAGAPTSDSDTASLAAVACATPTTCVALGLAASPPSSVVMVPIVAGAASTPQVIATDAAAFDPQNIACSTATECVSVGSSGALGAFVQLLLDGSPTGPPSATIASPSSGSSYSLNDAAQPEFEFSCAPAFASTLTSPGGCTATVNGTSVADGSAIDTSVGGSFMITVTADDADGEQATATASYTVAQAAQTITFPQIGPLRYGPTPVDLAASASSGLPVTYSVLSGPCAVAGQALTFTSSGSCVVSADQAGSASYLAAPSVTSMIEMNAPTPPVCAAQNVSTANAGAFVVALGCVDAPGDAGDALTYAIAAEPSHGALSGLDAVSGTVTYTPSGTYSGPDSFTFTAADAQGTSAATTVSIAVAPPVPPSDDSAPGVSGVVAAGQTLSCTPGVWYGATPQTYTYQWQRDGTAVAGATGPAYAIQAADEGRSLACIVTAVNTGGSARAASAVVDVPHTPPSTAPVTVARPAISGVAARGRTLSCSPGAWSGATPQTYAYQWKRGGASIAGATAARHVVSAADAGHRLTCTVTAKNSLGHRSAITTSIAIPPGSSAFTLRRVTAGKTGTIQVSLQAPGPGHFVVSAKFASTVSGSYGRATGTVTKAGRTQLAIHPTKQATAVLRGGHRESVAVSVAFTPTGGKASTKSAKLSLAAPGGSG